MMVYLFIVGRMMITLQEICRYLDNLLEVKNFNDFCVNGLQVEGKAEVGKIATAVSASLSTIEAAIDKGADLLLVHHGLFWNRDSYVIEGVKRQKLKLLLDHGISLLAYHLPLDAHTEFGNNWAAATEMGWSNLEPFGVYNGAPIGVKGIFPAQSREEFQQKLEKYYRHQAHTAPGGKELVTTAALISGGAHKSILEAAGEGVDCFITGSFDEPIWHQAFEEKINFYALGHANTEEIGPKALGKHLHDKFGVPVDFITIDNPF